MVIRNLDCTYCFYLPKLQSFLILTTTFLRLGSRVTAMAGQSGPAPLEVFSYETS